MTWTRRRAPAISWPRWNPFELVDGGLGGQMFETVDTLVLNGFAPPDFGEWPIAMQSVDSLPAANPAMSVVDPLTGGRYEIVRVERVVFSHFFPRLSTDNGPPLLSKRSNRCRFDQCKVIPIRRG